MARIIKASSKRDTPWKAEAAVDLSDFAEQARAVVLEARKEAARIAAEARAHADAACQAAEEKAYAEGLARGRNDGYEDGHRRGLTEAREEFAARAAGLTDLAERIVEELSQARDELLHRGRCDMLDFALELAEKIVGRVATRDAAAARENLRKVLELSDCAREACVKVHPSQLADLRECLAELTEALGRTAEVRLAPDEGISPGGVKLLTAAGEIDATIETQLANVVEALLGGAPADSPDGPCPEPPERAGGEWLEEGRYDPAGAPQPPESGKRPVFLDGPAVPPCPADEPAEGPPAVGAQAAEQSPTTSEP